MALVLSSFGKILLILMVIWDYGRLNPTYLINWFVFACNFQAVKVTLRLGSVATFLVMIFGFVSKVFVRLLTGLYDPAESLILL